MRIFKPKITDVYLNFTWITVLSVFTGYMYWFVTLITNKSSLKMFQIYSCDHQLKEPQSKGLLCS